MANPFQLTRVLEDPWDQDDNLGNRVTAETAVCKTCGSAELQSIERADTEQVFAHFVKSENDIWQPDWDALTFNEPERPAWETIGVTCNNCFADQLYEQGDDPIVTSLAEFTGQRNATGQLTLRGAWTR